MRVGVILTYPHMVNFRICGKYIFLTYAQAERIPTKEDLFAFLRDKHPTKIVVAKEDHQDGGQHFHALLYFAREFDSRNVAVFDFMGHHPNIQKAGAPKRTLAYVVKDGDYVNIGFTMPEAEKEDLFTVIQEEMETGNEPTAVIRAVMARTGTAGLRLYNNVAAYIDRVMVPSVVHQPRRDWILAFPVLGPELTLALTQFVEDVAVGFGDRGERKSLWITGPSRLGKTDLARSLGTHWYMCTAWNVDCYSDNAEYGVLDDIEWPGLQRYYKGIMGLQAHVTVTDKYKKKSVIRGGKPVIILSNELPVFTVQEALWLEANVNFVHVGRRLY